MCVLYLKTMKNNLGNLTDETKMFYYVVLLKPNRRKSAASHQSFNVSPVIRCVNSLHTGRGGTSKVCNSSLKELQRNHSCFSEAGLFFLFFFSSFLVFFLFAELKLDLSVENANICPRQAANTLPIRERVWTTLLYWSITMAGWQLWFATFLLWMETWQV